MFETHHEWQNVRSGLTFCHSGRSDGIGVWPDILPFREEDGIGVWPDIVSFRGCLKHRCLRLTMNGRMSGLTPIPSSSLNDTMIRPDPNL